MLFGNTGTNFVFFSGHAASRLSRDAESGFSLNLKFCFLYFQVNTVQFVLEEEGSSSSPATISKVPGTAHSWSTPPPFSPSSGSSKSITELGGPDDFGFGGFDLGQPSTSHVSSKTVGCTKTIRRKVVQTKDGPVETVEEGFSGGPECQGLTEFTKGGMSSLFPTLTHTSSSSSIQTKTIQTGGTKGSLLGDRKTGFMNPFGTGLDLGGFMTDNAEDDVPDFHARSVKTSTVERQDDYVGKGTKTSALE